MLGSKFTRPQNMLFTVYQMLLYIFQNDKYIMNKDYMYLNLCPMKQL